MIADNLFFLQVFDTRLAAAESFCSFFRVVGPNCTSVAFLPILVALYDTLNDDDEEVRDLGSVAFKHVTGVALVPIEAASRLLHWLALSFGNEPEFHSIIASRIIGHAAISGRISTAAASAQWTPASTQLTAALQFDDSLFAVEEQNLFVDEVRETKRWVEMSDSISWTGGVLQDGGGILARLSEWVSDGLAKLQSVVTENEDGPLGWASDAHVFAIATRIIHGYLVLAKRDAASDELIEQVELLRNTAKGKEHAVSRLLMDALH